MRRLTTRRTPRLAAVAITAVAIGAVGAGCGGDDDDGTSNSDSNTGTRTHATAPTQPPPAAANTIQVSGKEFSFNLSTKSVAKPGNVTFDFKNVGHVDHDFSINGKTTPLTQPGGTANLTVDLTKKGTYHYLCTVPGHAAAGMQGTFTVR
jgi:plastocyanin